jgi:ferredoxin-NADP reductase
VNWLVGTVVDVRDESPTARTIALTVAGWPGHVAGQHVDVRLTAPDGYSAARSYSIASAPNGERIELTVEMLADGEVSPYLARELAIGDPLEVRGPIGGWFVWRPTQSERVQLIAGGSGIAPIMAMIRTRAAAMRLLYSLREPEAMMYEEELRGIAASDSGVTVTYVYTRKTPADWPKPPGRIDAALFASACWPAAMGATSYVCGPTAFVETAADLLAAAGYDAPRIRTERFGPSGGTR